MRIGSLAALLGVVATAAACETCRPSVQAGVYNEAFAGTLGLLLIPVALIALVGLKLYRSDE